MKALSIRQPWAWLIATGWKNIENRYWPTRFRGRFLIHASKTMTADDYNACVLYLLGFTWGEQLVQVLPPMNFLKRGGIIGVATLLDCVDHHSSDWFEGDYGFVIGDPRQISFIPCTGRLNFFECPLEPEEAAICASFA